MCFLKLNTVNVEVGWWVPLNFGAQFQWLEGFHQSEKHESLFFLDNQSKRTLLGILQAQLSDFFTGNSSQDFGKLNWFTLGELQRSQANVPKLKLRTPSSSQDAHA